MQFILNVIKGILSIPYAVLMWFLIILLILLIIG